MRNFPIAFVIEQDLPNIKKHKSSSGFDINCPFCGKKKKMNINPNKNLARCNACGNGFNSLTLHAALCGVDNKTAYKDLWNRYNKLPSNLKTKIDEVKISEPEIKTMPLEMRDKIYRLFLSKLKLSSEHKKSLMDRGLSEKKINDLCYRDTPLTELDCSFILDNPEINDYIRKHKSYGIAGLFDLQSKPKCVARKPGILIPVIVKKPITGDLSESHDEDLISGLQVRYDEGEPRYAYYTSLEKKGGIGFTGCYNLHMRLPDSLFDDQKWRFVRKTLPKVALTEGCLKADVASFLTRHDFPFIAVLGVANQKYITSACKFLKEYYRTEEIVLMFDEDYVDNKNVKDSLIKAKEKIKSAGLKVSEYHWAKEYKELNIKGIDDFLLYKRKTAK